MKKKPLILAMLSLLSQNVKASDHIDGPVTTSHRVADLTDLYAFPTPNKDGSLSLILNTYPLVSETGHFTDKVTYSFLIRKAAKDQDNLKFKTSDEVVIDCNVSTPNDIKKHVITCKSSNGLAATNTYNSINPINPGDDFRLFAGMRSDPFFFNAPFAIAAAKGHRIPIQSQFLPSFVPEFFDKNQMDHLNILSIIIEVDIKKLYPENSEGLIAVATEVSTRDHSKAPVRILDRIGRPEITNVSMAVGNDEIEIRDFYNKLSPFGVSDNLKEKFAKRIQTNILSYDKIDLQPNWNQQNSLALSKVLADDFLVLDPSMSCENDSFLEIEKSMLLGKNHSSCGGRKPTDDIMDTLFTTYFGGFDRVHVSDGINEPFRDVSNEFPYLAEPDLSLFAKAALEAGLALLKIQEFFGSFK